MKFIFCVLCLFAVNFSWAESDYGGEPVQPGDQPYADAKFQYQTSFLLDRATFTRRQLSRLDIDGLILRAMHASGAAAAYRTEVTREGVVLNVVVDGNFIQVKRFFDIVLNQNLISLIYNIGGFFWSLPSDEYKTHWSTIYRNVQREVEMQAILAWSSKRKSMGGIEICSLMLEANRLNAAPSAGMNFKVPR